jgi:hypothetical protein
MTCMRAVMIAVVLASSALVAHADPPTPRSPEVALALSSLPVAGGIALFVGGIEAHVESHARTWLWTPMTAAGVAGILVGPTLGHVYAGHTWSNWLGLRLTGFAAMMIGGTIVLDKTHLKDSSSSCDDCEIPGFLALGGAGLFVVTTFGEILTAPGAAEDYNREHHLDLHLMPIQGTKTPGLAVSGSF